MKKTDMTKVITIIFCAVLLIPSLSLGQTYSSSSKTAISNASKHDNVFDIKIPVLSSKTIQGPDGITYQSFFFKDSQYLSIPGKPKLPITTYKFSIPSDASNIQVRLVNPTEKEEKLSVPLFPAPKSVLKKEQETSFVEDEFYKDNEFYEKNNDFFPQQYC